jgi:hypothetical protein
MQVNDNNVHHESMADIPDENVENLDGDSEKGQDIKKRSSVIHVSLRKNKNEDTLSVNKPRQSR